ncbi:MAG TPA: PolC-type DNA polymerase III [Clostridia bacterium]|nr:PolC-type DNA polymerase III [Clostridia bacterium]
MACCEGIGLNYVLNSFGLAENPSYESCYIKKVQYFKRSRKLLLRIMGKQILEYGQIKGSLHQLRKSIEGNSQIDVEICFFYDIKYKSPEELISMNWGNLLYILQENVSSFNVTNDPVSRHIMDFDLRLIFESDTIAGKMKEKKVEAQIEGYFLEQFNTTINCEIYMNNRGSDSGKHEPIEKRCSPTPVLFGRKFSGKTEKIADIGLGSDSVIIEGEIFSIEIKELKNGRELAILGITDYANSIIAKIFERKNQTIKFEKMFTEGMAIRARGNVKYDKFIKENVIMLTDVTKIDRAERNDLHHEKRIELHLHTQMSAMDGVSSISDFVEQASKWGHKAIALTDHGVVQAFPEAMDAGKKYGIKILYGVEGYFVNDRVKIVEGSSTYQFDEEFVVFDIETTGLSSKNDKITEIGAVKIKNGRITGSYSSLINPEIEIPAKITKLTGITDDMVRDKPTVETVLPEFLKFIGDRPVVAHNAGFDVAFIRENMKRIDGIFTNTIIDTLNLSRALLPNLKRHRLNIVAKELKVPLLEHHRAVDDSRATAKIFVELIEIMKSKNISSLKDINNQLGAKIDFKKLNTYHIVILAKNQIGLENLYKIVSESHLNYFYKKPRLILGTACEAGELFQGILSNKPIGQIEHIANYYDYLEIQPTANNMFLTERGMVKDENELKEINKNIVELGNKLKKPVVATGDVHFLNPEDSIFRQILMTGQGFENIGGQISLYFKTTDEMLEEFSYLGAEKSVEVVIQNPDKICSEIENLMPIPDGTFSPKIEGSEEELKKMCYNKAKKIYGEDMPTIVKGRLDKELNSIVNNGYAVMYVIAHKLVAKSLSDGYLVGSRGSVGSSLAATMSEITEVNPLPPHYVCPKCKYSDFISDGSYGAGVDLPDKSCPVCNEMLIKDGHDIPFEVFLGFEGDKEPDIDLNFASEYQSEAHKYIEKLFGEGKVFRAGTIGTIGSKTAYGFVRKYIEEKQLHYNTAEINRLTGGCMGVKRTSGQHPGGIIIVPADYDIHKFTPIQYPANDSKSGVITTHFDYDSISGRLLKLDILGHDVPTIIKMLEDLTNIGVQDIPLNNEETMDIFTGTKSLGICADEIDCEVGTLGIPEFGTKFVRQILIDTHPETFAELVRISGLSHGTDVWINNAQDLVRNNVAGLKDVISTRDDIMNYLISKELSPKTSFIIMENIRRGKGLTLGHEQEMKEHNVPQWYIDSCNKIKYMFPKAHATAYVMMSFRIAYFKVHYPEAFYAAYFTTKVEDFDADFIIRGKEAIRTKIKELRSMGNDATAKEKNHLAVLEVALEAYCRGVEVLPVDLYNSDTDRFMIAEGKLLPPLRGLQGIGQNAVKGIAEARQQGEFISLEDLRNRTKVSKTVIETLIAHGCVKGLPETNQLSLFSLA